MSDRMKEKDVRISIANGIGMAIEIDGIYLYA
jgi:hypothetical protein